MNTRTLIALLTAASLAACGDDDGGTGTDPVTPSYELDVTGALTETASGKAYFGTDTDGEGEPIFALLLGDENARHIVFAAKPGAARPGTGTYAFVDPESTQSGWTLLHFVSQGETLLGMFVAESGTLTITQSTPDVLKGTLEVRATGLMGEAPGVVELEGSFTAVPAADMAGLRAAGSR